VSKIKTRLGNKTNSFCVGLSKFLRELVLANPQQKLQNCRALRDKKPLNFPLQLGPTPPFINILWKAPFTSGTTSVSNRFRSSGSHSWLTKKLFSIAFASVHPTVIKTFHYYYNHIIEINLFSFFLACSRKVLLLLVLTLPACDTAKFGNIPLSSKFSPASKRTHDSQRILKQCPIVLH